MSRLTWTENDHGWRAEPYEIELAAPQLWVCTRRLRSGKVKVEMTSGSLSALKTSIDKCHRRRRSRRRSLICLSVFLLSIAVIGLASIIARDWTPLVVLVFSSVGLYAALKSVDYVVRRSWESVRLHYQ